MIRDVEPCFITLPCTGINLDKVSRLEEQIRAMELMASFYKLTRKDQLLMAALATEMTTARV